MPEYYGHKTCLNGWWDILPIFEPGPQSEVPQEGWLRGQYLVPSFWTKSHHGVRKQGETYYHATRKPEIFESDDYEFLFDAFGYPPQWSKTRAAWIRRTLSLDALNPNRQYLLIFDAVMPKTTLFVNGQKVCNHVHPTLPMEADVSQWLHTGNNEIALLIEDYDRDAKGRALVPTGNLIPCDHSGIWQDVWLVERGEVTVSDISIRTSTRDGTITLRYDVSNTSQHPQAVTLVPEIRNWQKDQDPERADCARTLPQQSLVVAAGETQQVELTKDWTDAELWFPENPKLYWLRTAVFATPQLSDPSQTTATHKPVDVVFERFGFREVWIEGPDILLNGHPVHLFSDWGHKSTPYYYTEGWIRQWFGMMRDANMNHSRLHTHPHPQIVLDLADEEGILITGETGLHGSGGAQAATSPAFWKAAHDHVRRFVQRDKNHPSLILWSVENEMRWNTKGRDAEYENAMIRAELPKLRARFNELDPTRPAYHDGDSSLWNEKTQPIISRHYGKECAGIGWWDRSRPLHSGEMALYHYAGPNNTLHLGGDAVYASFEVIDKIAAQDAALIIEAGRTLGVSCFGPWNLSCLENLRMEAEAIQLDYDDVTKPGVKPLQVPAHASEFSFWRKGKGYTPNYSFETQTHAFRPLAVIDRCQKTGYFAGDVFRREIFVVNDTAEELHGSLEVTLQGDKGALHTKVTDIIVERGRSVATTFTPHIPKDTTPGTYDYIATFRCADQIHDTWTRPIKIHRSQLRTQPTTTPLVRLPHIAVYGPGSLQDVLQMLNVSFSYIDTLSSATLTGAGILIMEKNTVQPGSNQNQVVRSFVQRGGRLILMEQLYTLFPKLTLDEKPALKAFIRAYEHPVLEGLDDEDFAFWGESPYALVAGDAYLTRRMYRKDDGRLMLPLLDSGEGGFGNGDLETTPLFETYEGKGLILACQLRLTDKLHDTPAAERLFINLLHYAAMVEAVEETPPMVISGKTTEGLSTILARAEGGKTIIVNHATPEALTAWSKTLNLNLRPRDVGDVYQVVRTFNDTLLSGISNGDTCGIETFSYAHGAENVRVGNTFLEPVPGLEALLVTPTESCLRELFVYGGRSEALRTHTLSRFLHAEKRQTAVALGRVRVGKGMILFNQFAAPDTRTRYARLGHRLQANLGKRYPGSLLDGKAVPSAQATSPGYPTQIYVYNGPIDADLWQQMQDSTQPSLERMLTTPILNLVTWETQQNDDGIWHANNLDLNQPIVLYYPIWSPAPRKNVDTNLDVPNPEALTFVDLEGMGDTQVIINCNGYPTLSLDQGPNTLSDIPLEMGGNHVLVKWAPKTPDATLKMRWRNIMRQPEVGLSFGSGGSVD